MSTTTVTATYLNPSGNGATGRVRFRLVAASYQTGLDAIFPTVMVNAALDNDGEMAVELEPTSGDDAAFDTDDMLYEVQERISGTEPRLYYVDVPTASSVDLGTLTTYDDPPAIARQYVIPDLTDLGYLTGDAADALYGRTQGVYVDAYAEGDGTTDDTTAIHQAATEAGDNGCLIWGPNTYKVTNLVFNQAGLTHLGAGRGNTVITQASGTSGVVFKINSSAGTFRNPFTISGLDIVGQGSGQDGLSIRYASVVTLSDVRVHDCGRDGLRLYEVTAVNASGCEFRDNAGNGVTLGKKADACTFQACGSYGNTGWGYSIGATTGESGGEGRVNTVSILGGTIILNTAGAALIDYASSNGIGFDGVYIEDNGATGSQVAVGVSGGDTVSAVDFHRCYFNGQSNQAHGIEVWNTRGITVRKCFFEAHDTGGVILNVAVPWVWEYSEVSAGTYSLQDASSNRVATNQRRFITDRLKIGAVDEPGTYDLQVARNDTTGGLFRVNQAGAGTAGTAVGALVADGTSTTAYALFARSKGTGLIADFHDATGSVLSVGKDSVIVREEILQANYTEFTAEIADPAAPAANKARFYIRDTGGKTELVVRFATGAVQQVAIEP